MTTQYATESFCAVALSLRQTHMYGFNHNIMYIKLSCAIKTFPSTWLLSHVGANLHVSPIIAMEAQACCLSTAQSLCSGSHNKTTNQQMKGRLLCDKKTHLCSQGTSGSCISGSNCSQRHWSLACCRPEWTADHVWLWPQWTVFDPIVGPQRWLALTLSVPKTPFKVLGQVVLSWRCRLSSFIDHRTWCIKALSSCCWVFQLLRHLLPSSPWLSDQWKLCEVISRQQSKHFTGAPSPRY